MEPATLDRSDDSTPGLIAGRPLEEWNAAYGKVEAYFVALGVCNKFLLGQLVSRVLARAMQRAREEPGREAMHLAVEEMDRDVTEWFVTVLDASEVPLDPLLSTRGRMALLLADMPGRWQEQFLKPPPWPAEFVHVMRESYLRAGPEFQLSQMDPRPIDLGPVAALTNLGTIAWVRMLFTWVLFAMAFAVIFHMTR